MSDATISSSSLPQHAERHAARRILRIAVALIVAGALANLVGWDLRGWFSNLWDTLTGISAAHIVAGVICMTIQTTATAYAWYVILRYAYPREVRFLPVFAAYTASVALNDVLPANLGTFMMFGMLTSLIASATVAGVVSGYCVEKIFFTVAGAFVYLYLFLSVPGSFDISFSWIKEHPWA